MGCSNGCKQAPAALIPTTKQLAAITTGIIDLQGIGLCELPDLGAVPKKEFAQKLDASHNKLEEVSERDLQLPNLTMLQLSYNLLRSVPDLRHLAFLETLDLRHNNLTALPAHIANIPSLTCLDLSGNQLTELPAAIGSCDSLRRLNVADNELTALPVELAQLSLERGGFDWLGNRLVFPPLEVREQGQKGIMDWLKMQSTMEQHPEVLQQKREELRWQQGDTDRWASEMRQCAWNTQEEYEEMLLRKPQWMDCAAAMRFIESHRHGGGWWPEDDYQPSVEVSAIPIVAAEVTSAAYHDKIKPSAPILAAPIGSLVPVPAVPVAKLVAIGQL